MPVFIANAKSKLYIGEQKVKKAYLGDVKVYSSGNIVTYRVDTGISYQEEAEEGASCLSPKTFTPTKAGWIFAGWREDTEANGSVLENKLMEDAPVTLYAIFKANVTLAYWDGTKNVQQTYTRFYNGSGAIFNPTAAIWQVGIAGWNPIGFTTDGSSAAGGITHQNGSVITMDSNKTFYARYNRTLTCRFDGGGATGGSTAAASGVQNRGNGGSTTSVNIVMPACGYSRDSYAFSGWSYTNLVLQPGAVITITESTYATATWRMAGVFIVQNGRHIYGGGEFKNYILIHQGAPSNTQRLYLNLSYGDGYLSNQFSNHSDLGAEGVLMQTNKITGLGSYSRINIEYSAQGNLDTHANAWTHLYVLFAYEWEDPYRVEREHMVFSAGYPQYGNFYNIPRRVESYDISSVSGDKMFMCRFGSCLSDGVVNIYNIWLS